MREGRSKKSGEQRHMEIEERDGDQKEVEVREEERK